MKILQVVLVFVVIVNCSECCKPFYECKSIRECPRMILLLQNRNAGDLEFVRKSNCGYVGKESLVCCPKLPCWTPDGREGDCMSIDDCPAIKSFSQSYKSTTSTKTSNILNYILKSRFRCPNVENGVCCPFPSRLPESSTQLELAPQSQKLSCLASELPPDPLSKCCGVDPEVGHRISRGAPTNRYTWLAILKYNVNIYCAGSLISGLYVLTAAHCVSETEPVSVLLGVYNRNKNGRDCNDEGENCMESQKINITKVIPHPKFSAKAGAPFTNDIALLQLSNMATFNEFVRPICLPSVAVCSTQNLKLISAGWGATESQDSGSNLKMSVELPFLETKNCSETMRMDLGAQHMCTGTMKGEGPCKGDSGGPLMHQTNGRFEAVGVHSFGFAKCGLKKWPHIFTNVMYYVPWINYNIKKHSSC